MSAVFLILGAAFVVISAALHVVIFSLESVSWSKPEVWKRFGVKSADEAAILKPMAFNQGFYNLFLGAGALVGFVLMAQGSLRDVGIALSLFAVGSMFLAAVVLISSNPKLARAAITQGVAPLLAVILLVVGTATS